MGRLVFYAGKIPKKAIVIAYLFVLGDKFGGSLGGRAFGARAVGLACFVWGHKSWLLLQ
ncbi:hypothetical protein ACWIW6_08455 [Ursidibacter sp. B-7004-1]